MKLTIEDLVICLALLLGFSTSLMLAIANESWGTHFPSSLIAFFASVSIAALIYRFLGGSGEAQFRMGVLQVTGSAAVMLGATWLLGDRIQMETALFRTDAEYRPQLDSKQAALADAQERNRKLLEQVHDLTERVSDLGTDKAKYSIDQVRRMRSDDPFVTGLRRMVVNEDAPFRQTLADLSARVTLNDAMTDSNVYRICTDTQAKLFDGLDTQNDRLRMRRNYGDGETRIVDMVRGGTIDPDAQVCGAGPGKTFDIQITCADATKLFPDRITRCNGLKPVYQPGYNSIRGERVTLGALPPR